MPARPKRDKRRRSTRITPEAVALFRQGMRATNDKQNGIALAAALGRSKFAASPLDSNPRSLIGCDTEPVDVVKDLRTQLQTKIRARAF